MVKKLFVLLLSCCICFSMSGCLPLLLLSDDSESSETSNSSSSIPDNTESSADSSEVEEESEPVFVTQEKANIAETVIYDQDGIKITALSLEDAYPQGQRLKVLLENNTENNITFIGDHFDVNGYTLYGLLYLDAAAGMKSNGYIEFTDMDKANVDEIAYLKSYDARIMNSDTYEDISSVPFELSTALADSYIPNYSPVGTQVINTDDFEAYVSTHYDSIWGTYIDVFLINKTDKDVIVESDNLSTNGFTIDEWMYEHICNNTALYGNILLSSESMETNGITDINEITFTLEFISASSYDTIYQSEELHVNFTE